MTCGFGDTGEGWEGDAHCCQCYLWLRAALRRFRQGVRDGTYDADGFTPNERKAQAKRRAA